MKVFDQLPQEMTLEEERIFCARTGLKTDSDREQLVNGKLREATKLVFTIAQQQLTVEEAVPLAFIGLTKAVKHYDHTRGIPFMGYAWRSLRGEVFRYFREEQKLGSHLATEGEADEADEAAQGVPLDLLGSDENDTEYRVFIKELYESVKHFIQEHFTQRDVAFFELRFRDNLSYRDLGARFNVSGAFVQARVEYLLRKYRQKCYDAT